MKILRQIISFSLPVTVLIIVPILIEQNFNLPELPAVILGGILILLSLFIITLTVRMFIRIGKGTLAPWDPTRKLVTASLYGYVRNPMILGVFCGLVGEAILFTSVKLGIWAVSFFIINTVYFKLSEEPGLHKRFGQEYDEYKKNVPMWLPRRKPWQPGQDKGKP